MFAVRLQGESWKYTIASDGAGYYAYLPATFIYHDLNYSFAEEKAPLYKKYPAIDIHLFGNKNAQGKRFNNYFIGTSLLQMPFFLLAYGISAITGASTDGYSYIFQLFIALAGIFYLLAGLTCTRKLLKNMNFSETIITIVLLLLFAGTNLYYYALEEPSMSHVYSFFLISFFLLCIQKLHIVFSERYFFLSCISFALVVLVRPTNGIIVLMVPFFMERGKFKQDFQKIKAGKKLLVAAVLIPLTLFFLQSLVWKISGGHWKENPYKSEHLDLLRPHFIAVLFGWRKGLFIYTPVLLPALAGVFFIPSYSKKILLLIFLFVNTWIIASWESWWYGGSFGLRPFIDSYPVFAIGFAFLFLQISNRIMKINVVLAASFFIFLNLFQTRQYHLSILPYDLMTWSKYKKIFLEYDPVFAGIYSPEKENKGNVPPGSRCIFTLKRNFDNDTFPNQTGVIKNEVCFSGNSSVRLDYNTKISGDVFIPLKQVPNLAGQCYIKAKAKIRLLEDVTDAKMAIVFKNRDKTCSWNGFYLIHRISNSGSWENYEIAIPLTPEMTASETASVYVIKDDDKTIYLDDLEVSFWKPE